jgi:hypothetical protein
MAPRTPEALAAAKVRKREHERRRRARERLSNPIACVKEVRKCAAALDGTIGSVNPLIIALYNWSMSAADDQVGGFYCRCRLRLGLAELKLAAYRRERDLRKAAQLEAQRARLERREPVIRPEVPAVVPDPRPLVDDEPSAVRASLLALCRETAENEYLTAYDRIRLLSNQITTLINIVHYQELDCAADDAARKLAAIEPDEAA